VRRRNSRSGSAKQHGSEHADFGVDMDVGHVSIVAEPRAFVVGTFVRAQGAVRHYGAGSHGRTLSHNGAGQPRSIPSAGARRRW
jgi:hypothetical protein